MKEDDYTWKDLDRSYWEGFDNAKNKMEKRIEKLEQQIKKMKSDVIECFGSEYNVLVAKLLNKWEIEK